MNTPSRRTQVTATDLDTGESETAEIGASDHVIICGPDCWIDCWIDSKVVHANGTTQYVIKRKRP